MSFTISPAVQRLFGSETRAKVLGLLADSSDPRTGYELSKKLGINPSKVYSVLHDLEDSGFIAVVTDQSGRKRYLLADEDLKSLLLRRVRIVAEDDWFSPARVRRRNEAIEAAKRLNVELPRRGANPLRVPNREEFVRPPEKDRALRLIARKRRGR